MSGRQLVTYDMINTELLYQKMYFNSHLLSLSLSLFLKKLLGLLTKRTYCYCDHRERPLAYHNCSANDGYPKFIALFLEAL